MEDVIQVYHLPYDPDYPQVCMDETCKQLIGEVQAPMACAPGRPARVGLSGMRACPGRVVFRPAGFDLALAYYYGLEQYPTASFDPTAGTLLG